MYPRLSTAVLLLFLSTELVTGRGRLSLWQSLIRDRQTSSDDIGSGTGDDDCESGCDDNGVGPINGLISGTNSRHVVRVQTTRPRNAIDFIGGPSGRRASSDMPGSRKFLTDDSPGKPVDCLLWDDDEDCYQVRSSGDFGYNPPGDVVDLRPPSSLTARPKNLQMENVYLVRGRDREDARPTPSYLVTRDKAVGRNSPPPSPTSPLRSPVGPQWSTSHDLDHRSRQTVPPLHLATAVTGGSGLEDGGAAYKIEGRRTPPSRKFTLPPSMPQRSTTNLGLNIGLIIGIATGVVVLFLVLAYALYRYRSCVGGTVRGSYRLDSAAADSCGYNGLRSASSTADRHLVHHVEPRVGVVSSCSMSGTMARSKSNCKIPAKEWYV